MCVELVKLSREQIYRFACRLNGYRKQGIVDTRWIAKALDMAVVAWAMRVRIAYPVRPLPE
jgi:hypothetical protein